MNMQIENVNGYADELYSKSANGRALTVEL